MTGDYPSAEDKFKKSLELDPQNVAAHYNLGNALLLMKKTDQAIQAFEKALELDENNHEWRCMVAGIYLEKKDWTGADKHINFILDKNPSNLEALFVKGEFQNPKMNNFLVQKHEMQEHYEEALSIAKKIKRVNANFEGIDAKIDELEAKQKK